MGQKTVVKTTVVLPTDLWRAAKIRAMDEGTDLKGLIQAALDAYLKAKPAKRGA